MTYVIDECMGRGKTCAAINFINSSPDRRFIFVTPYLNEVKRIKEQCADRHFEEPEAVKGECTKLSDFNEMFRQGKNIATTHSLFKLIPSDFFDAIQKKHYTLILDEALEIHERLSISPKDRAAFEKCFIEKEVVDGLTVIKWADNKYYGALDNYKNIIEKNKLIAYSPTYWAKTFPLDFLDKFDDTYIMTYMFKGQYLGAYMDAQNREYTRLYIGGNSPDTFYFSDAPAPREPLNYKELIRILDNKSYNAIGDGRTALSKSWYMRHCTKESLLPLKKNVYNFFFNYLKSPSNNNIWTTFGESDDGRVSWKKLLSGAGYTKGYLPCNIRGTNDYRERSAVAYLVNRFPNTCLYNFLLARGVKIDQKGYALSEMLQFIWRSAIRDGKPIDLYIPSERMRDMLKEWIEILANGGDVNDW